MTPRHHTVAAIVSRKFDYMAVASPQLVGELIDRLERVERDLLEVRSGAQPVLADENSVRCQIGRIGNEIHNLACDHQNNEALCDRLEDLRGRCWKLAEAPALQKLDVGASENVPGRAGR